MESAHFTSPCPVRIGDDLGSAFSMGFIGSMGWQAFKAVRGKGKWMACIYRPPTTAMSFAAWGGFFSVFDCTLSGVRSREDHWNAIMAGALTGGVLAWRRRQKFIIKQAMIGGALLALIEGLGYGISYGMNYYNNREQMAQQHAAMAAAEARNRAVKLQQSPTTATEQPPAEEKKGWFSSLLSSPPPPPPVITPLESFQEFAHDDEFIPNYDFAFDDREDLMDD